MSFKLIDLQFAIQKNSDVGLHQSMLQQKLANDQAVLTDQTEKQAQTNRKKSEKLEHKAKGKIGARTGQGGGNNGQASGSSGNEPGKTSPETAQEAGHPYKGRHIDLSL